MGLLRCRSPLSDPTSQIFFLLRFLCFMAVVYLALHKVVAKLSRKPDSKLLWFFSVVTAPLTRPIKMRFAPGTADDRILSAALLFYLAVWLIVILIERALITASN